MHETDPRFSEHVWRSDLQLLRQHIDGFVALDPAVGIEIHRLIERLTQGSEPEIKTILQQHMYGLEAAIFSGDETEISVQRRIVLQELDKLLPSA